MVVNVTDIFTRLRNFDFNTLFIDELSWNKPKDKASFPFQINKTEFSRQAVAELSGATVYEITSTEGSIPGIKTREIISNEMHLNGKHILIFVDNNRTQTVWSWLKKQDKKSLPREYYFSIGQTADSFITVLVAVLKDISEIDNDSSIAGAAAKIQSALNTGRVTKQFYNSYQHQFIDFLKLIEGIGNEADRRWYASVMLNRLMFIYFLQKKGFIGNNNQDYLYSKLKAAKKSGKNQYYNSFLKPLFLNGFTKAEHLRGATGNKLSGKIKSHGRLFLKHKIEEKYPGINIPDIAFENLLQPGEPRGFFEKFSWNLDDMPGGQDSEINPAVLGYIFEKYVNQKAFGAYYTCREITVYLCEQTIYKLILDAVNEDEAEPAVRKETATGKSSQKIIYPTITELLISPDAVTCRKLVYGDKAILPNLSLLDPACGSGAFLVEAMKTLVNVYAAILGRIDFLGDKELSEWKKKIAEDHPNINYYVKKQVITRNLYAVDIMEEATDIAKLRLYLALAASAQTVEQLEPLPDIDFNIMCGNSLIGLLRVDANNELVGKKEAAITNYNKASKRQVPELQKLRDDIQKQETTASEILNELLLEEFSTLGIRYEQVTWDDIKNKEGKPVKRSLSLADIKALKPFHWGYQFSEIFSKKGGFDAIITNPPWDVFQTNEKEFFQEYDKEIKKKKLLIGDWEKNKEELMKDEEIRSAWLSYSSQYPHQWAYLKKSLQYKNQVSVVNGNTVGNKPNLYCLFTEQCKNLLKPKGYCGIVIPAGIYTDLGTKQLREMLFDENKITGLFCFENRKTIFENIDSRFKFVVLSFEKSGRTKKFPTAFMRHDVEELQYFPDYGALHISVDLVKKLSPDSYSIIEFKSGQELRIAEKISKHPLLCGDKDGWNLELYGEEMNMTRSANRFLTRPAKFTLYEGGMIWHFTNTFSEARYWINEKDIWTDFLSKRVKRIEGLSSQPKDLKNDYETYRLAIRKIASNTNERTLITTIIPKNAIAGNSLTVNFPFQHHYQKYNELSFSNTDLFILTSILNSYVVDFILRSRVTTNLNLFYIYQLPVPRLAATDKWYKLIIGRAAKLICTTGEFAELWEEVMKTKWTEKAGVSTEPERSRLRAELDGIIAHIYGMTEEEFTYILGTFPIVAAVQKEAAHAAYRDVKNGILK